MGGGGVGEIFKVAPLGNPFYSANIGTIFGPTMRSFHPPGGKAIRGLFFFYRMRSVAVLLILKKRESSRSDVFLN